MKTKILLAVCLVLASISAAKALNGVGTVILHHQGNVTVYWGNDIQDAVDASAKGDTLYLSEGTFKGFSVSHGITVIGSGMNTIVNGLITISGDEVKTSLDNYEFSGLNLPAYRDNYSSLQSNIKIKGYIKGFRMSQCSMVILRLTDDCKQFEDVEINMSSISDIIELSPAAKNVTIMNSLINWISNTTEFNNMVSLCHCNVRRSNGNIDHPIIFYGCIISEAEYATLLNCLYYTSYGVLQESWTGSLDRLYNQWNDVTKYPYSDEELRESGYICSDNTLVGATGGETPYTLELIAPHVTDHKIDVDNVSRTVKVTLKMSGDAKNN